MINITRSARSLMMLLTLMLLTQEGWAQLLTENFSYSTAGNITSATANWTAHSGTTFYPQYTNSGLTFNGHAGSGVGGAITISSSGVADVNRTFTSQNSGTVYMSCLVNFSAGSGSVSDYFLHFNSGTFNARVQALTSTTNLRFGVSKAGTPAAVATNFSFNTTYLLVVKYTFNTGSLTDDNVDLWVLSSFASTEILAGTPLQSTSSGTDATSLSAVAIRQGTPPTGTIDAIRVGTTWASVTPPATYTLTYNGNSNTSGTAPTDASSPYTSGANVTVLDNTGSLARTNYSFSGWNTLADGSGTDRAVASTFTMPASNTTLYAKWTGTVTYNGNSNTSGTVPSDATNYLPSTTVTVANNTGTLARTGYTFAGWNTASDGSGTTYIAGSGTFTFSGNVTLYAQWTANTLTVTYNSQGGSSVSDGSTTTGGTVSDPGIPTRSGYTFNGWFVASSGGTSITFPYSHGQTADFTLYAQWTANTLTVTFNSQGGSSISDGSTTTGGTISDPGNPTRSGYTFNGWFVASSGGSAITFPYSHGQTSDFTLYAQWTLATPDPIINVVTLTQALSTTYGTASTGIAFTASGSNLSANIDVAAQSGFEVSTSLGTGYSTFVSVASGTTVYVRFAATKSASNYNSVTAAELSSTGAATVNATTSTSGNTILTKQLLITGITISNKTYDGTNAATISGAAVYSGLENGETFSVVGAPNASFSDKNVANGKAVTISGYEPPNTNYTVTQPTFTADITVLSLFLTGAIVSDKTYDGTTSAIVGGTLSGVISGDVVSLNGSGTFASANVGNSIAVTSTSTLSGADAANYSLTQPVGLTANITKADQTIAALTTPITKVLNDGSYSAATTASSGLTVSYSSSNTAVATVASDGTVTFQGVGTTTIIASQSGNGNYNAATDVTQDLTVNPNPTISATPSSLVAFSSASGVASAAQAFTVTGSNLVSDITVTAPTGFEVSQTSGGASGYASSQTLVQSGGSVSNVVFVRMSTTATGSPSGNVTLASSSVTTVNISVSGSVISCGTLPSHNGTLAQVGWTESSLAQGASSSNDYVQMLQSTSSLVSPAYNSGSYSSLKLDFKARTFGGPSTAQATITISISTNNGSTYSTIGTVVPATTTLTAQTQLDLSSYAGSQVKIRFQTLGAGSSKGVGIDDVVISGSCNSAISFGGGPLTPLSTSYGTASSPINFSLTGISLGSTISIAALSGFEFNNPSVNSDYTSTLSGISATGPTSINVRLSASAMPGSYSGNIVCSSGSTSLNIPMPAGTVSATVPSSPTITQITSGDQLLVVSFNAPGSNGGASITTYKYSTDGGTTWRTRSSGTTGSPLNISYLSSDGTTTLTNGSPYDVKILAVNSVGDGAASNTVSGTPNPPRAEPTSHPSSFVAVVGTPSQSSITLSWVDAQDLVIPDGYLIVGSPVSFADITPPTDGIVVPNGGLNLNVVQGIQAATFAGLSSNTNYYFKIYPYSNAGILIDYKTSGSVQQTSVATIRESSATDYFRSKQTGTWGDAGTWESSDNNSVWNSATLAPDNNANTITILNTHDITIAAPVTADQLVVNSGGQITLSSTLTIADGTGTDMDVSGTILNSGASGGITLNASANINFGASSTYDHARNGGVIPIATWHVTSTCIVSGMIGTVPSAGFGQVFGNFTWNCTGQTAFAIIGASGTFNPKGLMKVISTGITVIELESGGLGSTYNFDGGLVIEGGKFVVNYDNSGTTLEATLNINGDLTISNSGIFDVAQGNGNSATSGYSASINLSGDLYLNGTNPYPFTATAPNNYARIFFNGSSSQNYYRTGNTGSQYVDYIVNSGKTLNLQNDLLVFSFSSTIYDIVTINGTLNSFDKSIAQSSGTNARFIINTGATLSTSNAGGIYAAINVGGAKTFSTGAKYVFNGATSTPFPTNAQIATFGSPASVDVNADITFNRTGVTITDALNLNTGTLADGGNTITLSGNITGTGSHSGTGKITMSGSGKTISGATLGNLELNNAGGFSLTGSPSISQLTFVAGKLTLGNYNVTVSGSISGQSANGYVVTNGTGSLKRSVAASGSYAFPVGTNNYAPVTFTINSVGTPGTISARTTTSDHPQGANSFPLDYTRKLNRYWTIENDGVDVSTSNRAQVDFNWVASELGSTVYGFNIPALKVAKYSGSSWSIASTSNPTSTSITASNISSFSDFVIALPTGAAVLPVSLTSFSGYKDGFRNQLRWVTSSEVNNSGFEVQRSADGVNYQSIGFVNSLAIGGNSQTQLKYNFTDANPNGLKQYYRLKQFDIDGRSSLSNILLIQGEKPAAFEIASVYPNPSRGQVTVLLNAPENKVVTIRLIDLAGRVLQTRQVNVLAGNNSIPFDISNLAKGQYLISVDGKSVKVVRE